MSQFALGSSKATNQVLLEDDEEWMDRVPRISRTNITGLKDNNQMTDDNTKLRENNTHFSKPRIYQFHSSSSSTNIIRNASVRQSYPTATQSISQQDRDENDMLDTVELKNIQKMQEVSRMSASVSDKKLPTKVDPSSLSGGRPFVIPKQELEILLDRDEHVNRDLKSFSLDDHSEIKWHHRAILLDWTLEVCSELGLKRQTW
jgi:hypothetical protein